jgi:hypothetical protein
MNLIFKTHRFRGRPTKMRSAAALLLLAVASGATDIKPRCTSTESIAAGTFIGDTWTPDSGCFVAVPDKAEMLRILRGSWLLMCGGSNTLVTLQTIVRQLAPQAWEVRCAPPASVPVLVLEDEPRLAAASRGRSAARPVPRGHSPPSAALHIEMCESIFQAWRCSQDHAFARSANIALSLP